MNLFFDKFYNIVIYFILLLNSIYENLFWED